MSAITTPDILFPLFGGMQVNAVLRIASTCRLWRDIARDQRLWRIYSSRDWPQGFAQAQGIEDWKVWYRSHYFVAYAPLFGINMRRTYSHSFTYNLEAYWKGIACRQETFVAVAKELDISSYFKEAYVLNRVRQQQKERLGIYEYKKGGNWPAIADDIVLLMGHARILGFSLTRGNPYGTSGLQFAKDNVMAFNTYDKWVGVLLDGQIELYTLSRDEPGKRGSLVKSFYFEKSEKRPAFLYMTRNRVVAVFPGQKLLIFDIEHDSPLAVLALKPGNWTIKGDLLYYLDVDCLSEIDINRGNIKRTLPCPSHLAVKIFSQEGRMACGKDFLALLAGDKRKAEEALFLYVVRLSDFTITGSRQMDRTDGHLQAYDNLLLIGRECDAYNLTTKRKGIVGILDLESLEFLDRLRCSSIGARPFFYDGNIVAVSSNFIDFWKIEGIRTPTKRSQGHGNVTLPT